MEIMLKLSPSFRRPELQDTTIDLKQGATLRDLLKKVDMSLHCFHLALVDGRKLGLDGALKNGDTVTLLPLIGGG